VVRSTGNKASTEFSNCFLELELGYVREFLNGNFWRKAVVHAETKPLIAASKRATAGPGFAAMVRQRPKAGLIAMQWPASRRPV
jgi:hypothetical protein